MFKYLIEFTLILIGGIILVSQIIVPVVMAAFGSDLELFWIFKKSKSKVEIPNGEVAQIAAELRKASEQHKTSAKKVDEAITVLKEAKSEK